MEFLAWMNVCVWSIMCLVEQDPFIAISLHKDEQWTVTWAPFSKHDKSSICRINGCNCVFITALLLSVNMPRKKKEGSFPSLFQPTSVQFSSLKLYLDLGGNWRNYYTTTKSDKTHKAKLGVQLKIHVFKCFSLGAMNGYKCFDIWR